MPGVWGAQPVSHIFRGVTKAKYPGTSGTPERRQGEERTFVLEAGAGRLEQGRAGVKPHFGR